MTKKWKKLKNKDKKKLKLGPRGYVIMWRPKIAKHGYSVTNPCQRSFTFKHRHWWFKTEPSPSQKINYPDQEKWATTPTPRPEDSPPRTRASSTTAPSKASPTILLLFRIYRLSRLSVSRRRSLLSVPPAVLLYLPSTTTTTIINIMDTKPLPVSLPPQSMMIHNSFLFLFQFQFQFQAQDFVLMWLVWFRLCCCWGTTCKRTKASLLWYWDGLVIVSWFTFTLIQSIFLLVCLFDCAILRFRALKFLCNGNFLY